MVILAAAELLVHYAAVWFPESAFFTFSFVVPICAVVLMRWGWQAIFFAITSGLMYCALNGGAAVSYLTYCIGNSFVLLALIPLKFIGSEKITSKWTWSALFVLICWFCIYIGRAAVWTVCYAVNPVSGAAFYSGFIQFAATDLLSLAMAVTIVLVLRRFNGMFENQITYLKRFDSERRNALKPDAFGDEPIEIDSESLSVLKWHNDDLY